METSEEDDDNYPSDDDDNDVTKSKDYIKFMLKEHSYHKRVGNELYNVTYNYHDDDDVDALKNINPQTMVFSILLKTFL